MAGQVAVINLIPMDEELFGIVEKRKVDDRVKFSWFKDFLVLVNKFYGTWLF